MPPLRKFSSEDIVNIAYKIVKDEGFENLNARKVASKLNSSVQPIFHNFSSMEELNSKVYDKICDTYKEYILSGINGEQPYKAVGLSYIKFAKDYPEFFKIMFMQKTYLGAIDFVMSDATGKDIIKAGQILSGLSYEEQKKFHVKVWIFTHGIACLVATKTVEFSDKEIEDMLTNTVREMLIGYNIEKKGGNLHGKCD